MTHRTRGRGALTQDREGLPRGEPEKCSECGFLWSLSVEDAIRLVEGAADRYTSLLAKGAGSRSDDPTTLPSHTTRPVQRVFLAAFRRTGDRWPIARLHVSWSSDVTDN